MLVFLNVCRNIPQEHGITVVAFHLESIQGNVNLYFPKGRYTVKDSSKGLDKIM